MKTLAIVSGRVILPWNWWPIMCCKGQPSEREGVVVAEEKLPCWLSQYYAIAARPNAAFLMRRLLSVIGGERV